MGDHEDDSSTESAGLTNASLSSLGNDGTFGVNVADFLSYVISVPRRPPETFK